MLCKLNLILITNYSNALQATIAQLENTRIDSSVGKVNTHQQVK